jgi:NAD(P)H-flavin reductase/NAD-dependent dihydropyrimidine dehydrogenase PreA subunit
MVTELALDHWWLPRGDLERLIEVLHEDGRRVIGPTVEDEAIVYRELGSVADLPHGVSDRQSPGNYRLVRAIDDHAEAQPTFGFASSPTSWKQFTFPPSIPLGEARRDGEELTFSPAPREIMPMAFLGVRPCDLAAMEIHRHVLAGGPFVDDDYLERRSAAMVIAVECAAPSATCFCTSMGTGPQATGGYDIALTELEDGFVVRAGSWAGQTLLARLALAPASEDQVEGARASTERARATMGERLPMDGLSERLLRRLDHPRWADVAERCLACTSCTMVCPTCFCTSVTQRSDLGGTVATTERRWDSCFTLGFASVAGGNFRSRPQDRYRQWLTHKFGTWVDQFGTYGCVGCGRCITWCPVGIDVREELMAIAPPEPRAMTAVMPVPAAAATALFATVSLGAVRPETVDTFTLTFRDLPDAVLAGLPGQFLMLELPGFSAVPISVSRYLPDGVELTIRAAGAATREITQLPIGSQIGVRGPLGRGWPLANAAGRDVIVVAGGIGLAPLRPLIDSLLTLREQFGEVRLAIGARTPADLLFHADVEAWAARGDVVVETTVDRAGPDWKGPVGVVTQLFDRTRLDGARTSAYVCGPEKMMQASARTLSALGVPAERTFVSMERHMECGIGLCGHCQLGRFFVCRDGPVFSRAELGETFELEGV